MRDWLWGRSTKEIEAKKETALMILSRATFIINSTVVH